MRNANIPWVLAESHALIRYRTTAAEALRFLEEVYVAERQRELLIVRPNAGHEATARRLLRRHQGLWLSYTDAVTLAVIEERRISDAFAFDQDLAAAGVNLIPSRAPS